MSDRNITLPVTFSSSTVQHRLPTTGGEEHVFTPFREQIRQQIQTQSESEEDRLSRLFGDLRTRQTWRMDMPRFIVPWDIRATDTRAPWARNQQEYNDYAEDERRRRRVEAARIRTAMADGAPSDPAQLARIQADVANAFVSDPQAPVMRGFSPVEIDEFEVLDLGSARMDARPQLARIQTLETDNDSARSRATPQTPLDNSFPLSDMENSPNSEAYQQLTADQGQNVRDNSLSTTGNANIRPQAHGLWEDAEYDALDRDYSSGPFAARIADMLVQPQRLWEYEDLEALDRDYQNGPIPGRVAGIQAETQRLWEDSRGIENLTSRNIEAYYNNPDLAPRTPEVNRAAEIQVLDADIDRLESSIRGMDSVGGNPLTIDPLRSPLTDISPNAERLTIHAAIRDGQTLLDGMENRFVSDPRGAGLILLTPEHLADYQRIAAEVHELYDRLQNLEIFGDLESPLGQETPDLIVTPTAFLRGLPVVPYHELPENDRECNICQEPYLTGCWSDVVRLPCGHLFGVRCLSTWLCTEGDTVPNTCPMCRAVLFEVPHQRRFIIFAVTEIEAIDDPLEDLHAAPTRGEDLPDDSMREPMPLEWQGADRFLDHIQRLDFILSRGDEYPDEAISFFETRHGTIDARFMRPAGTHLAGERSFAEHVLILFRVFVERPGPAGARDREAAAALTALMGRLYESLQEPMRVHRVSIVWTENGPPVGFLIDPAAIPLLELALEWLVMVDAGSQGRDNGDATR